VDRVAHVDVRPGAGRRSGVSRRVVVVGAGWSGLACALALTDSGVEVTVLDAAPQVGGRARRVQLQLGDRGYALDNGQHLLLGAYRETLALMRRVGVDPQVAFKRLPFALRYPDGVELVARRAPAPWHLAAALAFARGFGWRERFAAASWMRRWQRGGWRAPADAAASALCDGQPRVLVERVWEPLCLAALNVRLAEASAQVFLNVLRDSLGGDADAAELLLPRCDLSRLFPDAAARAIAAQAELRLRCPVLAIERTAARWRLALRGQQREADAIVLALPPDRAADLLRACAPAEAAALAAVAAAPIATVYLRYPPSTRLTHPVYALREQPGRGDFGQWVFDRGHTDADCAGVLSVVVSGSGPHLNLSQDRLAAAVSRQLAAALGLGAPLAAAVLTEKRATLVPRPGLLRPAPRLSAPGLYLAGDAAASPYPSTIEGSVRAGLAAARAVLSDA
jgi:squalene-associated FAD-dependent desaturase